LVDGSFALGPASDGSVGAEEEEAEGDEDNNDTRDDKIDAPCDVGGEAILPEGVVDGRHDKVCDTSTSITETSRKGVCGTDDVLIEETFCFIRKTLEANRIFLLTCHPHLTWDERATEDTDEETVDVEAGSTRDTAGAECRNGSGEQAEHESPSRSEQIASITSKETNKESGNLSAGAIVTALHQDVRGYQSDNVGVTNDGSGDLEVGLDDVRE